MIMLDIFICSDNKHDAEILKSFCLKYLIQKNIDSDIKVLTENELNVGNETALFIIESDKHFLECVSSVRELNRQNYIIAIINALEELAHIVLPTVRLSGYLLKPVSEENTITLLNGIYSDHTNSGSRTVMFRFKIKAREFSIPLNKIILFESSNKKVIVRTETQEFEYYDTLESMSSMLPETFIRIHKSFIINIDRMASVDYASQTVYMDDGTEACLSRTYKANFKELLVSLSARLENI